MSDSVQNSSDLPVAVSPKGRLEIVRGAGRWMPWAGLILAVVWWGALAVALVTVFDLNVIASQPPITLIGGGMIAVLPGLLILMASFMARESARGAAANTLVLEAATQLLDPSEASLRKADSMAARMTASAEEIERSFDEVVAAMKAMAGEIGDERLRLESVSYATADNARDLAGQLAAERSALEGLIRDLRAQGDTLNEAIPRQAERMVQAARTAATEISRADEALDQRLSAMRVSTDSLATELNRLNALARDSGQQSDAVLQAVADIEARLEQAHALVDEAISASDSAVNAANKTGEALREAVSSALSDARRASVEIEARTRESSEEAARQISALQESAEQAGQALKLAGVAARAETDITERRLSQTTTALQRAIGTSTPPRPVEADDDGPILAETPKPMPAPAPVPTPETPPGRDHPTNSPLFAAPPMRPAPTGNSAGLPSSNGNGHSNGNGYSNGNGHHHTPAATGNGSVPAISHAGPPDGPVRKISDDELFDGNDEPAPKAASDPFAPDLTISMPGGMETERSVQTATPATPPPFDPLDDLDDEVELEANPAPAPPNAVSEPRPQQAAPSREEAGWSSILNDMDREAAGEMGREETAETVIRRLETAGVHLANVFRPKDKKKIAQAARKGEQQRRLAIQSAARNELERVARQVRGNDALADLAKDFVSMEAPDAIAALERTHATNRNASPRLSAFLLLDAAMGG